MLRVDMGTIWRFSKKQCFTPVEVLKFHNNMTLNSKTVSYVYLTKKILTFVGLQAPADGIYFENNQAHPDKKSVVLLLLQCIFQILAV